MSDPICAVCERPIHGAVTRGPLASGIVVDTHETERACIDALRGALALATSTGGPTARALALVAAERSRQNEKFKRTPGRWDDEDGDKLAVLGEEYGEVCRARWERAPVHMLRGEIVDLAAVAVCWIENLLPSLGDG
jgi:hypothetical protein